MNRRGFLTGILAAPAIIRTPGLLMALSVPRFEVLNEAWLERALVDIRKMKDEAGLKVSDYMTATHTWWIDGTGFHHWGPV